MKKIYLWLTIIMVLFLLCGTQVYANLSSTFTSGSEGWTGVDALEHDWTSTWYSTGGNPGGYLRGVEPYPQGGTGYYIAPSSWFGNWNQYLGGTLQYDIKIFSGSSYFSDKDVIICSGGSCMSLINTSDDWSGWKTFTVALNASSFGVSETYFNTIMSNVTSLNIRGEYINGSEAEGFDNVQVTSPNTIPEPVTFMLLGLGLMGIAGMRIKFEK